MSSNTENNTAPPTDAPAADESVATPAAAPAHAEEHSKAQDNHAAAALDTNNADAAQHATQPEPEPEPEAVPAPEQAALAQLDGIGTAATAAPSVSMVHERPEDNQLGGLDVSGATPQQLAAFAAQLSAAFVESGGSAAFQDGTAGGSAPALSEAMDSAAFSLEFARAAAHDAAFGVLASNSGTREDETGPSTHDAQHLAQGSSDLAPPPAPPMLDLDMGMRDFVVNPDHSADSHPRPDEDAGESPEKRRRTSKSAGNRSAQSEGESSVPVVKKPRKPRREKYGNVTAQIEDDTKTLEGVGRLWVANRDKKKRVPLTELFTRLWLQDKFRAQSDTEISRKQVYASYEQDCQAHGVTGVNDSALGRAVRAEFPHVGTRRLGKRGESTYYYTGIFPKDVPLPEPVDLTSERAASESSSSRKKRYLQKKDALDSRAPRASENGRTLPPAAYSTNPPQMIVQKPSVPPYNVSSARSGSAASRAPDWYSSSNHNSATSSRALRSGVAASAASSNMRTHIADDDADSEEASVPAPPPPAPGTEDSVAERVNTTHEGSVAATQPPSSSEVPADGSDPTALEGPSDVAASALFMLNQGGVPPPPSQPPQVSAPDSHPAAATVLAPSNPPAPPLRASTRRAHATGLVAMRSTSSVHAGPQARPELSNTESIFAPRQRDPNAPPRRARKSSTKKKDGTEKESAQDGSGATASAPHVEAGSGNQQQGENGSVKTAKGKGKAKPVENEFDPAHPQMGPTPLSPRPPPSTDTATVAAAAAAAAAAVAAADAVDRHMLNLDGHTDGRMDIAPPPSGAGLADQGESQGDGGVGANVGMGGSGGRDEGSRLRADADMIRRSAEMAAVLSARAALEAQHEVDKAVELDEEGHRGVAVDVNAIDPALRDVGP
ncbi:hypothetical protein OC835_002888 [Tilletia horrida]|nr:hypothetical protein OC835_002888 [Tilletia horrida]